MMAMTARRSSLSSCAAAFRVFLAGIGGAIFLALPSVSAELTLSNMQISLGAARLRLPSVTFTGDALDPEAITALRLGRTANDLSAALTHIGAERIALPEISFELLVGNTGHTVTCRSVTLTRLDKGIAAEATSEGCAWTSASADTARTIRRGTTGAFHAKALDLAGLVNAASTSALHPLPAGTITLNDVLLAAPSGQSFLAGTLVLTREAGSAKTIVEAGALRFAATRSADEKGGPLTATAANGHAELGTTVAMTLTSLAFSANSSHMTIGALATESGDALPLAALARGEDNVGAMLGRWFARVSALSINGVEADHSGPAGQVHWSLGRFDARRLQPDGQRAGVDATLERLIIPTATLPDATGRLRDLGYQTLTLDAHAKTRWTASDQTLDIEDMTIKAGELGSLSLAGRLDNVASTLFEADGLKAADALNTARLHKISLTIIDLGLAERVSAVGAGASGRSTEAVRSEFAASLSTNIRARLGQSRGASTIADAVSRFVRTPGELTLTIAAQDPLVGAVQPIPVRPALAGPAIASFLDRMEVAASLK